MKAAVSPIAKILPALVVFWTCCLGACAGETVPASDTEVAPSALQGEDRAELLAPPAGSGSMAPRLMPAPGGALLTWLEPVAVVQRGETRMGGKGTTRLMLAELRLATSRLSPTRATWSAPRQIVEGDEFFANWADLPAAVEGQDGVRFAHWLEMLGEDTYTYGVQLARSTDGGETWERLGLLHDDASPAEHGFVSYVPLAEGVQAFWLDGRAMVVGANEGGPAEQPGTMQLRTTRLGREGGPPASVVLDDRVCECCQTGAALTDGGPIVVYRDRDRSEIRDVAVVRGTGDGNWTEPAILHADRWQIHGCPVNGPAVAADGHDVAVAWFTAAQETARVMVAFSSDSGATFGTPIEIDGEKPSGRVGVVLDRGQAYVSWLGTIGEAAEIRLRRVAPSGELGEVRRVAETTANRSSGIPQMVRLGDNLLLSWVEDADPSRITAGLVAREP